MPAHIEIKWIDKKWFSMPEEERVPALEKQAAEFDKGGWSADEQKANPFPSWVRDIIKKKLGVKAKYDPENAIYTITVPGDTDDADDLYEKFAELYNAAAAESPERTEWKNNNHLQVSISTSEQSEGALMAELESYLGGRQAQQGSPKLPVAKEEEGREAPAEADNEKQD